MRSSLWFAALPLVLAATASCSVRGTGPDSIEVGGDCDSDDDFNDCEEVCLTDAHTCVLRCKSDDDCPTGSACTAIRLMYDDDNDTVCLPLCSTVPCGGYDQGLCCGSVPRASGMGMVSVCNSPNGTGFACNGY